MLFKNQFQTMGVVVPIMCASIYVVLISWWSFKDDENDLCQDYIIDDYKNASSSSTIVNEKRFVL